MSRLLVALAVSLTCVSAAAPAVAQPLRWSAPVQIDPGHRLVSVSCPGGGFCAAVDNSGQALILSHGHWSHPVRLERSLYGLRSVSCAERSFCVAVGAGDAFTYLGRRWSGPRVIFRPHRFQADLVAVSCPSRSFCLATEGGFFIVMHDGRWTTHGFAANPGALSCVSASFCVGVGDGRGGGALIYDGRRWSRSVDIDGEQYLRGVSCASSRFCVAVDGRGRRLVYRAGRWSRPVLVDTRGGLLSVSCPDLSFCVAGDWHGNVVVDEGGRWSTPVSVHAHSLWSLSCPSRAFCAAVDDTGEAVVMGGMNAAMRVQA